MGATRLVNMNRRLSDRYVTIDLALARISSGAAVFGVWWRAGFGKQKRSKVEPVMTSRQRSVFLNVCELNHWHVMPGGLQGCAIESHPITLVQR